jgi:glycosyltransferase involved in cell wall biosynthesis
MGSRLVVTAIESCGMDGTYAWEKVEGAESFARVTLTAREGAGLHWRRIVRRRLLEELERSRPQVVAVPGWACCEAVSALEWCARSRTPAVLMSESAGQDEPRRPWREWVKRRVVKLCSAGLVGGERHADYLAVLGMQRERIFLGYDAVDNRYFEEQSRAAAGQGANGNGHKYFLAVARFVEKKNLRRLIEGYAGYRKREEVREKKGGRREKGGGRGERTNAEKLKTEKLKGELWDLVLLGDGEMRGELEARVAALGLSNHVHIPGFKQYAELPRYYGQASAFILASTTEQWGLVVNEAMASGLPVVASNRCGCAPELVRDGVNGFTFDPLDTSRIAELMKRVAGLDEAQRALMGARSREIIADWGPERFASGLERAVQAALRMPGPAASIMDRLLLRILALR